MKGKNILFGIFVLLCLNLVLADAPITPPTLSPNNLASFINNPTLTCSGSTDADGDDINQTIAQVFTPEFPLSAPDDNILRSSSTGTNDALSIVKLSVGDEYILLSEVRQSGSGSSSYVCGSDLYEGNTEAEGGILINSWSTAGSGSCSSGSLTANIYTFTEAGGDGFEELLLKANTDYYFQRTGRSCQSGSCTGTGWSNTPSTGTNPPIVPSFNMTDYSGVRYIAGVFTNETNTSAFITTLQNSSATTYEWNLTGTGTIGTSYFWSCNAYDNNGEYSNWTTGRQLNFLNFSECEAGSPNTALNFTIKDEVDHTILLNSESSCAFTLSTDDDDGNYSFTFDDPNTFSLCLAPSGASASLSGFVSYLPTSSDYNFTRQYNFLNDVINGNDTQYINLYSLKDADTSLVLIRVKDRFGTLLQGAKVTIQRFIDGVWLTIMELTTDPLGRTQGQYRLNTAYYNHIIEYNGQVVLGELNSDTDKIQIYTEDVTNGITFNVNLEGEGLLQLFQKTFTLNSNLSYHNVTNTTGFFKYEFFDTTGKQWLTCLQVDKGLNPTEICGCAEYNVTSNTGTITCNTNQTDGRQIYYANAFLYNTATNSWFNNNQLSLSLGFDERIDWGGTGYIIALFLILVITFVFLKSPTIAVLLGTFMFVLLAGTGVIFKSGQNSLSWSVLIVIMVIGYLVARLKSEGGANG